MLKICNYVENGLLDPPIMLKILVIMSKNDGFMLKIGRIMLKLEALCTPKITKMPVHINTEGGTWPPFKLTLIDGLATADQWHNHANLILTFALLGSLVSLTHHLNLLLLHPILAHLRILADAHLVTRTLLRSTITDMARYNIKFLYHDRTKISNVFLGSRYLEYGGTEGY